MATNSLKFTSRSVYFCRIMHAIGRIFYLLFLIVAGLSCKTQNSADKPTQDSGTFILSKNISINPHNTYLGFQTYSGMIWVPGGPITLQDPRTTDSVTVYVQSFLMDSTEVTVGQFADFIQASGYRTDAQKFGNAGVFDMGSRSWSLVDSAFWLYPQSNHRAMAHADDPVTQLSWYDAKAFCAWRGKRLPNEIEWEHAARNGRNDRSLYSWGSDWQSTETVFGNVWQGDFPEEFKNLDGYESVAPVGRFRASPLGFKDLSGNVWEWCDNWRFDYAELTSGIFNAVDEKVMRGGSFLCAPNYCHGYMIASRSFTTPETSLFHIGCRCAKDVE